MTFDKVIKLVPADLKAKLDKELRCAGYNVVNRDGFLYAEGSIPVLLCAHTDTVHKHPVSSICKSDAGIWMAPEGIGGDDRCGIYMILQIIRHYHCSVLFTDDEEIGCVGAKKFTESGIMPNVNFIIEFDRRGEDDCVFYQCDNPAFTKYIENAGFKLAYGSCSDISTVAPYIGKAAVNLSCGYYNPHTQHEFIVIDDMWNTIRKVERMLDKPLESFEYIKKTYSYSTNAYTFNAQSQAFISEFYKTYTQPETTKPLLAPPATPKENKSKKHWDCFDEAVQDVIWLWGVYGDDEIYAMHDSHSDYPELMSALDYGIGEDGTVWYQHPSSGKIYMDNSVRFYDVSGNELFPATLYNQLIAGQADTFATFRALNGTMEGY